MAQVRYECVTKTFGSVVALSELTLTIPNGTFLALLGPSGCGKTTALRILAGLDTPTNGRVFIGERDVTSLEPRKRDVAMVFQNYALYPHMNVAGNIGYPLRIRGLGPATIAGTHPGRCPSIDDRGASRPKAKGAIWGAASEGGTCPRDHS